jgi:hypothetical protein
MDEVAGDHEGTDSEEEDAGYFNEEQGYFDEEGRLSGWPT